jgi:hypothetical protein
MGETLPWLEAGLVLTGPSTSRMIDTAFKAGKYDILMANR